MCTVARPLEVELPSCSASCDDLPPGYMRTAEGVIVVRVVPWWVWWPPQAMLLAGELEYLLPNSVVTLGLFTDELELLFHFTLLGVSCRDHLGRLALRRWLRRRRRGRACGLRGAAAAERLPGVASVSDPGGRWEADGRGRCRGLSA